MTHVPALLALASVFQSSVDPFRLPIGTPGEIALTPNTITHLATGRPASFAEIAKAARDHKYVFVGESHDQKAHHEFQAQVIEALVADGRDVIIGFEMFSRFNDGLDGWTLGWWTEEEFIAKSDWKAQWGFDFALYRPIFQAARRHRLPMKGLNVPRDWVRRVGRQGLQGLTPEERGQIPEVDTQYIPHRKVFEALMGGHPMTGTQGENIYSAQVVWDVAMGDSAVKAMRALPPNRRTVMVVIAGVGHVMYGAGINYRIQKQTGESGLTLIPLTAPQGTTVSRGVGHYAVALP